MTFEDKNRTLQAPEGYTLDAVIPDGAYLRMEYSQARFKTGTLKRIGSSCVTIFLNDMGREVGRSIRMGYLPDAFTPEPAKPVSVSRWFRFKNGILIAIQGFQEMSKCLKK